MDTSKFVWKGWWTLSTSSKRQYGTDVEVLDIAHETSYSRLPGDDGHSVSEFVTFDANMTVDVQDRDVFT